MPISITVDTRESKLQDHLKPRLQALEVEMQVAPLEIGDIEITHNDPDFRIIIERKTERDLSASLKDGRYHEQKARILATIPSQHCIYLIENPCKPTWGANATSCCSAGAYAGAIIHSMFRDGIHVAITDGIKDTADWVMTIFNKCRDNPQKFLPRDGNNNETAYVTCAKIKTKKLDNVDPHTCFLLQLGQIPGISGKLAKQIAEVYPNWRSLLNAVDSAYESGGEKAAIAMFSQIPLIGSKKAKTILDYLKNSPSESA